MKPGNKNKTGKKDEVGVRAAVMDVLAKHGVKNVVPVRTCGTVSLTLTSKDTPPPSGGNREVNDLLKKIHELTKPSGAGKEIDPLPKNGSKRKKGGSAVRFYWQYTEQDDLPVPIFAITPKDFFDAERCLSDEHFDEEGIPKGFSNVMESQFEFDGTHEQAEALLRANPLFEEKDMV